MTPASCVIGTPSLAALFGLEGGTSLNGCPLIATALTAFEFARGALPFEIATIGCARRFSVAASMRVHIAHTSMRDGARSATGSHVAASHPGTEWVARHRQRRSRPGPGARPFADALRQPRATLSHWSGAFTRALRELGWPGTQALDESELLMLQTFNDALAELATLDGIAGAVSLDAAVRNLSNLASRGRFQEPYERTRRHDPRPVGGPCVVMTASGWPACTLRCGPGRRDPIRSSPSICNLLPASPRRSGNARSRPKHHPEHSRRGAPRDRGRPRHLADADAEPSPLLTSLPAIDAGGARASRAPGYEQEIFESGSLEVLQDEQAPAIPTPAQLRGGASALNANPNVRFRLRATSAAREASRATAASIDPRTRGSFLHRALDSLWSELRDRDALLLLSAEERQGLVLAVVASARSEIFGRSGAGLYRSSTSNAGVSKHCCATGSRSRASGHPFGYSAWSSDCNGARPG